MFVISKASYISLHSLFRLTDTMAIFFADKFQTRFQFSGLYLVSYITPQE